LDTLDLSPKTRGVKYKDQILKVRKLNIKEVKTIEKQLIAAAKDSDKSLEIQEKMMVACGVPQEIIDEIDIDQFQDLGKFIMGAKKN